MQTLSSLLQPLALLECTDDECRKIADEKSMA